MLGAAMKGLECVHCSATFQVAADAPVATCCFCLHAVKPRPQLDTLWSGPALPIHYDRPRFESAIQQFLNAIGRGHEWDLPVYRLPLDLKPVWMPFRRIRVRSEQRFLRGSAGDVPVVRKDFEMDVFCGAGIDEHLVQELQLFAQDLPHLSSSTLSAAALRAGEASDDDLGMRAASSLRRWLVEHRPADKTQELSARFLEAPEAGQLYWMPIWLLVFELNGEHCVIAMDAVEGRVVAHLPRAPQPVDYLKHLLPIVKPTKPADAASDAKPIIDLAPAWVFWPVDRLSGLCLVLLSTFAMSQEHRFWLLGAALMVWLGGALSRAYLSQSRRFARSGLAEDINLFKYYQNLNAIVQTSTVLLVAAFVAYWSQHGLLGWQAPPHVSSQVARRAEVDAPSAPASSVESPLAVKAARVAPSEITVGSEGITDIARAVALSHPNDVIRISAESHPQYNAPIVIDHNLRIVGEPGSEVIWRNGTGPFVQVVGQDVHVSIEHVHLVAKNIRGTVIGATAPNNVRNVLTLKDVWVDSQGGSALVVSGKNSAVEIIGGGYRSDRVPMVFNHLARLQFKPADQQVTQIEVRAQESERVEHAVVLSDVRQVALENVSFIGASGASVALVGDVEEALILAVSPNRSTTLAILRDPQAAVPLFEISEPGRYRVHQGQLEVLDPL